MQAQLREARLARNEDQCCGCPLCCVPLCNCTAGCVRCCRLTRFTVTALVSLIWAVVRQSTTRLKISTRTIRRTQAPWVVAVAEVTAVVVYYLTSVDNALFTRRPWHGFLASFSWFRNVEDVVLLSVLRFVAVLLAYGFGAGRAYQRCVLVAADFLFFLAHRTHTQHCRPYLYASVICACIALPYTLPKALLFHYPPRPAAWHFITLMALTMGYSVFHVLTANRVMTWARRRFHMGLVGFGYPWEAGEEAARLHASYVEAGPVDVSDADVPGEALADEDSRFVSIGGLQVHYKCWGAGETGVVLVHGFGGGVFSWRHVGPALAAEAGCSVVAFDRPGFGALTGC